MPVNSLALCLVSFLPQIIKREFYWLLLQDRLNTRGLLKRKNMKLESYTCELCLLQMEEKLKHLFLSAHLQKIGVGFVSQSNHGYDHKGQQGI
jgi:hypothetical protein